MFFRKKEKRGLFLSIELLAVIVVVSVIVIIVATGLRHLYKIYGAYTITKEISMYGEAIIQFKNLYDYWPGDIPVSKIVGDLKSSTLSSVETFWSITAMTSTYDSHCRCPSGTAGTATCASFFGKLMDNSHCKLGSGVVSGYKAPSSWAYLSLSGLIPPTLIDINGAHNNFYNGASSVYPSSSFNKNVKYIFGVDYCDKAGACLTPLGSAISNSTYNVYGQNWSGKPRIVAYYSYDPILTTANIVKCNSYLDTVSPYYLKITQDAKTTGVAAFSSNLAYIIDQKIDDGLPFGKSSKVIGEDVIDWTGGEANYLCEGRSATINNVPTTKTLAANGSFYGCTDLYSADQGVTLKTGLTQSSYFNAKYINSGIADGNKGCLMTFRIS